MTTRLRELWFGRRARSLELRSSAVVHCRPTEYATAGSVIQGVCGGGAGKKKAGRIKAELLSEDRLGWLIQKETLSRFTRQTSKHNFFWSLWRRHLTQGFLKRIKERMRGRALVPRWRWTIVRSSLGDFPLARRAGLGRTRRAVWGEDLGPDDGVTRMGRTGVVD